jgi:hypothetical protein
LECRSLTEQPLEFFFLFGGWFTITPDTGHQADLSGAPKGASMVPIRNGRSSSSEDKNVQVIAGGLLGWLADRGFETDFWLPTGFIVGIVTGIGVLLRGALKMNKALDRAAAKKRRSGSDKVDS